MDDVAKTSSDETTTKEEYIEIPSDEPITKEEEDFLNREPFVRQVSNLIDANIKPPYSIGIYGDWGSGKTSIMKLIEEKISKLKRYEVIWFDAWEYENETNLVYPLVHLIKKEIPKNELKGILLTVEKLSNVLVKAGLEFITNLATAGILNIKKLEKFEKDYVKQHTKVFEDWIDGVSEVKKAFRELTEVACKPKREKGEKDPKKCIVIFIDDLDRCLPESTIRILESIKNIFSQGNCIFILGVDKNTTARVIKGRYPTLEEFECIDYLAKIVPFGLDIPEYEVRDFGKYLDWLIFTKLKIEFTKEPEKMDKADTVKIDLLSISNVCVSARLHNPRKIKRSLIAFYQYYKIRQSNGFDSDFVSQIKSEVVTYQDVLFFCLFCQFWNDLFEKVLISNNLFVQLAEAALNTDFQQWQGRFSIEATHPVLKSCATDENLYHFLCGWAQTKEEEIERVKFKKRAEFINVLIRIGKLIGLKKK